MILMVPSPSCKTLTCCSYENHIRYIQSKIQSVVVGRYLPVFLLVFFCFLLLDVWRIFCTNRPPPVGVSFLVLSVHHGPVTNTIFYLLISVESSISSLLISDSIMMPLLSSQCYQSFTKPNKQILFGSTIFLEVLQIC